MGFITQQVCKSTFTYPVTHSHPLRALDRRDIAWGNSTALEGSFHTQRLGEASLTKGPSCRCPMITHCLYASLLKIIVVVVYVYDNCVCAHTWKLEKKQLLGVISVLSQWVLGTKMSSQACSEHNSSCGVSLLGLCFSLLMEACLLGRCQVLIMRLGTWWHLVSVC